VWAPDVVDRVEPTVRRNPLGVVEKKKKPLGVVDRVGPMFREHAGMADREASVVRVERVVLLEVENEVGHADEGAKDSGNAGSRKRIKDSLGPVFFERILLAHTGGCAVWWGRMS
jgi:hypothetical protein